MKQWHESHIKVSMEQTMHYLKTINQINVAQLYENIKIELSKEEDFDYLVGKGAEYFGKKIASNGNAIVKHDNDEEIEFEVSFDYIAVKREDDSNIGDNLKHCVFSFKVDKHKKSISYYVPPLISLAMSAG